MDRPQEKSSFVQIRIREDLKEDLKVTADLRGLTVSALLHSLINRAVLEGRREHPKAYSDYSPPPEIVAESEFDRILLEASDGRRISPEVRRRIAEVVKAALRVQEVAEDGTEIE